jgi:hypothetical protein
VRVTRGSAGDAGAGPSATGQTTSGATDEAGAGAGDNAGTGTGQPGGGGGPDAGPAGSATTSLIRFADWAPDAPATGFDICLQGGDTISWTGPVLREGVTFPNVSGYVSITPGSYALRVVAPGSPTCDAPVASVVGMPQLQAGSRATFAFVGDSAPVGNDPPGKVVAFPDDTTSGRGPTAVRFINATPAAAAVDFGTIGAHSGGFAPLAVDVQFGQASSIAPGAATPPDADGYLHLDATPGVTLGARQVGTGTAIATGSNASWTAGSILTVALVNGSSNGPPPQLVVCRDSSPAQGGFTPCSVLSP